MDGQLSVVFDSEVLGALAGLQRVALLKHLEAKAAELFRRDVVLCGVSHAHFCLGVIAWCSFFSCWPTPSMPTTWPAWKVGAGGSVCRAVAGSAEAGCVCVCSGRHEQQL